MEEPVNTIRFFRNFVTITIFWSNIFLLKCVKLVLIVISNGSVGSLEEEE